MTVDTLMFYFAGGLFLIVMSLVAWIFTSQTNMQNKKIDVLVESVNNLRELLDVKLTRISDKNFEIEKALRGDLAGLDRRTTTLEASESIRRHGRA
ncbi:MAG: hypothetical protein ABIT70_05665 [Sulfuriferula sp.]